MGVSTVRPDSYAQVLTGSGSAVNVGGAATPQAAVSDNSDSTYIALLAPSGGGAYCDFTFPAPTVPAGAVIASITPKIRANTPPYSAPVANCNITMFGPNFTSTQRGITSSTGGFATQNGDAATSKTNGQAFTASDVDTGVTVRVVNYSTLMTLQLAEVYLDVTYNEAPTVTPAAGFNSATSKPTVAWTYADPEFNAQLTKRIKLFNSAQYGAGGFDPNTSTPEVDSGVITDGASTWQVTTDLVNGATYRAYIFVTDAGSGNPPNIVNAAGPYQQIVILMAAPNVPTISVTTSSTAKGFSNRLAIAATNNLVGSVSKYNFEVQRSLDGGTTWATIKRLQDATLANAAYGSVNYSANASPSVVLFDYEVPRNVVAYYRVRAVAVNGSNNLISTWSSGANAGAPVGQTDWWLKSLSNANQNAKVFPNDEELEFQSEEPMSVNRALGRKNPVILSDVIGGEQWPTELTVLTQAEYDALELLRSTQTTLLIQSPYGDHLYVRLGSMRASRWVLNGDGTRKRAVKVSFIEQDTP